MLLPNVQTGAQIYLINGLDEPPSEREVNMYSVAHLQPPPCSPQITKLLLKNLFN